jgi:hypothetical protein
LLLALTSETVACFGELYQNVSGIFLKFVLIFWLNISCYIFPLNSFTVSDDAHDRPSKKDLLIGKRKDKKDSKKDRGYAALEGESSPEEDPEMKLVSLTSV